MQLAPANFASNGALFTTTHTAINAGSNTALDSSANPNAMFMGQGYAVSTTLTTAKPEDLTLDFGFTTAPGRLGNYVWFESTADGVQGTSGETAISGVIVNLYNSQGQLIATTTTDANGFYLFEGLPLGVTYVVQLAPSNFAATGVLSTYYTVPSGQGNNAIDSNANGGATFNGQGYAVTTTLTTVKPEDLTLDFGFTQGLGRLGDTVWYEANANGVQGDNDEILLSGVVVDLYNATTGQYLASATTEIGRASCRERVCELV